MKLEFKQIACYFPYELKIMQYRDDLKLSFESNLISLSNDTLGVTSPRFPFNEKIQYHEAKLILRPLSDLNRYGEDIINEHSINLLISEKYNLDYGILSHFKGELSIDLDGDPDLRYDANKSISFNVMLTIQEELLKGHYDIFNLIENNLAIDINTIK